MTQDFRIRLAVLAEEALQRAGTKYQYRPEDMFNASLIFMEVFSNLMFDKHSEFLDVQHMGKLMEELGKNLHQIIHIGTGIDMKEVVEHGQELTRAANKARGWAAGIAEEQE